jgi:hypothetical protein
MFRISLIIALTAGVASGQAPTQYRVMYGHSDDPGVTDAFRQQVVPTFNVIEGTSADASFINELRAQGKVYAAHVLNPTNETAAQLLARWRAPFDDTLGGQLPGGYDAIAIDELWGSSTNGTAHSNAVVSALSQLRALYPDKQIYVAAAYNYGYSSANYTDQLSALNQYADLIMIENYLREDTYSYRFFDSYADHLKAAVPGILNKTVYGLLVSQGGLVADSSTDVGYWGFLDDQMYRIRNDADASTMPGVMCWVYYRSEKDLTPDFVSKLVDHYYAQGNTSYFGDGSMEQLIGNPQFEGSTSGWTLSPGAGGSVGTFDYSSVSIENDHDNFGQASHGTSGLRMIRGATPNEASFQVDGLDPNSVYTVSAFVNSESTGQQASLSITELDGTLIERETATNVGSPPDYIDKWNEWTRLIFHFVPTATTVNVVLSDETANVGTTLYWDFVELERAFRKPEPTVLDLVPPAADFDEDGYVGSADLIVWEVNYGTGGTATHAQGDADGNGSVDGNDFLIWQRQFAMGFPANHAALPSAVPEPATGPLLLMGLALTSRRHRCQLWGGRGEIRPRARAVPFIV